MTVSEEQTAPIALEVWDSRPVLVLIHAFPLDRRMWLTQAHELSELANLEAPATFSAAVAGFLAGL